MSAKFRLAILASCAFALSGCRVETVQGTIVQTQQPVYQAAPVPLRQIEGPWQMRERGRFVRNIDVRRVRGGVEITTQRNRFFAQRVAPGVFQDDRGRLYEFASNFEGRFENPNNGRRMRIVRP